MELSPVTNLLLSGLTGGEPQRSWELWHLGSRRHCRDWDPCVHSIFSAGDAFSGCSECTRHSRSGNLIFPGLTGVRHLWRLVAQGTRSVALAPPGSRTLLAYAAARQADRPALRLRCVRDACSRRTGTLLVPLSRGPAQRGTAEDAELEVPRCPGTHAIWTE